MVLVCAGGPAFAQSGPFAYHGLLAFYVPMVIWGLWLDTHAWFMRREVQRRIASPAPSQSGAAEMAGAMRR